MDRGRSKGKAILGGSFNPPHVGHLRLAVEVFEALGPLVQSMDLLPCAVPPHKKSQGLLPFDLRAAMLEAVIRPLPFLHCNRLEGSLPGPSYTWDTLQAYRREDSESTFYFVLGSTDYALLAEWYNGLQLPSLCDFVILPRGHEGSEAFKAQTLCLWPHAVEHEPLMASATCMALPGGGLAHFLPVPWLAVSGTRIRQLWLAGRHVDYLVPEAALEILRKHHEAIMAHWQENSS